MTDARLQKDVRFFSHGARIAGVLRVPAGKGPHPVVVMCTGMTLTKEVWLPANAEWLCERGYATLNFDYRGWGESEGPRQRLAPQLQVEDVREAITFLETIPELDSKRVALFGISLGAAVSVATAGVDQRVKAAVAVAGPMDLHRVWRTLPGFEGFNAMVHAARQKAVATGEVSFIKLTKLLAGDPQTCAVIERDAKTIPQWKPEASFESLADLFEFKPEAVVDRISPRAVLFIETEHEETIAKGELKSGFDKAREPKRLVTLRDLQHHEIYGGGAAFTPMMEATRQFLAEFV